MKVEQIFRQWKYVSRFPPCLASGQLLSLLSTASKKHDIFTENSGISLIFFTKRPIVNSVDKSRIKMSLTEGEFSAFSPHGHKCVVVVWQCQIFTISHTMEAGKAGAKWRPCQSSPRSPIMQLPTFVNNVTSFPPLKLYNSHNSHLFIQQHIQTTEQGNQKNKK